MIVEGESIGDYDARNAAEAGRVCGDLNTARWHLRRGLKPTELDEQCSQVYRAFHRQNGALRNKVRQRTLAALKDENFEEFEKLRDHYRLEVDFYSIGSGEVASPSKLANRARQMALRELGKRYREDYKRIYMLKLIEIVMEEEADDGRR